MVDYILIILLVIDCLSKIMLWRRLEELEELKSDMRSVKRQINDNHDKIIKMKWYSNNK